MESTAEHYSLALLCAVILTVTVVAVHYEALRVFSVLHPKRWSGRVNIGVLIVCIIVVHCMEALVFALGFWLSDHWLGLGGLTGSREITPVVYIYFALETYTTQSLGDIYPVGASRLIASVEPLVGLILIGWSTSFTYVMMRRDWQFDDRTQAEKRSGQ